MLASDPVIRLDQRRITPTNGEEMHLKPPPLQDGFHGPLTPFGYDPEHRHPFRFPGHFHLPNPFLPGKRKGPPDPPRVLQEFRAVRAGGTGERLVLKLNGQFFQAKEKDCQGKRGLETAKDPTDPYRPEVRTHPSVEYRFQAVQFIQARWRFSKVNERCAVPVPAGSGTPPGRRCSGRPPEPDRPPAGSSAGDRGKGYKVRTHPRPRTGATQRDPLNCGQAEGSPVGEL